MKRQWYVIWGLVLLTVIGGQVSSDEYWLKYERGEVGFGYQHVVSTVRDDGAIEYVWQQHIKSDVAGFNPQDIVEWGTFLVDSNLVPLQCDYKYESPYYHLIVNGYGGASDHSPGGFFSFGCWNDLGESCDREVERDSGYFQVSLPDFIHRADVDGSHQIYIIDPKTHDRAAIDIEISATDSGGKSAVVTYGSLTTTYTLDNAGNIQEIHNANTGVRQYRTDSADAVDITYLNTANELTLTVPGEKAFANVYRVITAQIAVSWHNVALIDMDFVDNRQRLVDSASVSSSRRAVVEIQRLNSITYDDNVPVDRDEFASFLGESKYIKPFDSLIIAQAESIRGTATDSRIIVEQILTWVHDNIATAYISETLDGPTVLRGGQGKCSEKAILFASLARAAGIPTRLVMGVVTDGSQWVGHMWNEVRLGKQWIAVDPSAGDFVRYVNHLKMLSGPDIDAMYFPRMALLDQFEVHVLQYAVDSADTNESLQTGIDENTYTNAAFACEISRPDSNWTMDVQYRSGRVSVVFAPPNADGVKCELTLFAIPPGTDPAAVLNGRLTALATRVPGFAIIGHDSLEVAGTHTPRMTFLSEYRERESDPLILRSDNIMCIRDANGYLFKCTAPKGEYERYESYFAKFIGSFTLYE